MATYVELTGTGDTPEGIIRDWANRDYNVIPQTVVTRCLDWSADICYKKLQIPPLEETLEFTVESNDIETIEDSRQVLSLPIPEDMIEPIFLRRDSDGTVFSSRIDRRTIYDADSDRLWNSFTQIGNDYKIFGRFASGEVITLHYYRRLPGLNATYDVTALNYNGDGGVGNPAGVGTVGTGHYISATGFHVNDTPVTAQASSGTNIYLVNTTGTVPNGTTVTGVAYSTYALANAARESGESVYHVTTAVGNEVSHWLRDENERILIYGALVEIFNFLDEPETMDRYKRLFEEEIARLNVEQNRRFTMGGNLQVSYSGRGLL